MTAKEMFEKLGLKEKYNNEHEIAYQYKCTINEVIFIRENKHIAFIELNGIDMKLLKAINKQVEELHWNE